MTAKGTGITSTRIDFGCQFGGHSTAAPVNREGQGMPDVKAAAVSIVYHEPGSRQHVFHAGGQKLHVR